MGDYNNLCFNTADVVPDTPHDINGLVKAYHDFTFCRTPFLSLGSGVDFTFAWVNKNNKNKNPHQLY